MQMLPDKQLLYKNLSYTIIVVNIIVNFTYIIYILQSKCNLHEQFAAWQIFSIVQFKSVMTDTLTDMVFI